MKLIKHLLIMVALVTGLGACEANSQRNDDTPEDGVEVLYFHGRQRCATCQAIENETKDLIDSQFADEVKSEKVRYRIVDITKAENEALADKYEITWSSLVLVKYNDGKEISENLTKFAFASARNNPAQFKKELAEKINKLLE